MPFARKIIPATVAGESVYFREPTLGELRRIDQQPENERLTALAVLVVCNADGTPMFATTAEAEEVPVSALSALAEGFQTAMADLTKKKH